MGDTTLTDAGNASFLFLNQLLTSHATDWTSISGFSKTSDKHFPRCRNTKIVIIEREKNATFFLPVCCENTIEEGCQIAILIE